MHRPVGDARQDRYDRKPVDKLRIFTGYPELVEAPAQGHKARKGDVGKQARNLHGDSELLQQLLLPALGIGLEKARDKGLVHHGVEALHNGVHGLGDGELAHGKRREHLVAHQQVKPAVEEIAHHVEGGPEALHHQLFHRGKRIVHPGGFQHGQKLPAHPEIRKRDDERGAQRAEAHPRDLRREKHIGRDEHRRVCQIRQDLEIALPVHAIAHVARAAEHGEDRRHPEGCEREGKQKLDILRERRRDGDHAVEKHRQQQGQPQQRKAQVHIAPEHRGIVDIGLTDILPVIAQADIARRVDVQRGGHDGGILSKLLCESHKAVGLGADGPGDVGRQDKRDAVADHIGHAGDKHRAGHVQDLVPFCGVFFRCHRQHLLDR